MSEDLEVGPGQGTLRTPFVELYLGNTTIPLLDGPGAGGSGFLLQNFSYSVSNKIGAGNTVEMTIIDPTWEKLEDLLILNVTQRGSSPMSPQFSFRYGWRGIDDVQGRAPITMNVLDWNIAFTPFGGAHVTIFGCDQGLNLSLTTTNSGFTQDTLISDAIKRLIEEVNLEASVEPTTNMVGEDHLGMGRTRLQWITELMGRAQGLDGKSAFIMTTEILAGGKTKVKVGQAKESSDIVRRYFFARERSGQMTSFKPKYSGVLMANLGGQKSEATGYDPVKKSVTKVTSDKSEDVSASPKDITPVPQEPCRNWETPYSEVKDVEAYVRRRRETADASVYTAEATVYGDTGLWPMQMVEVLVLKGNTRPGVYLPKNFHNTSGPYLVQELSHIISDGQFKTTLHLVRHRGFTGLNAIGQLIKMNQDVPARALAQVKATVSRLIPRVF